MNVTLTFVEYDAVNSLRDLSPVAFTLVSTAKLGKIGNHRTWIVDGNSDAFGALRSDIGDAMGRFLRSSVAASLADVTKSIDDAMVLSSAEGLPAALIPALPAGVLGDPAGTLPSPESRRCASQEP